MKYLILINREYPYRKGETYLENEMREIIGFFDKIIIFPGDITLKEKPSRTINSENVSTIKYEMMPLKIRKIFYVFNSIKYLFSKENEGKKIINKIEEAYFLSAAYTQFRKIKRELDKIRFSSEDELYFYSYWLYINAKVVTLLKKQYYDIGKNKIRAFSRAHRFDIYEERRKYKYLPQRCHLLNDLDCVFPCSMDGRNHIAKKYPQFNKKIQTSYLGTYDNGLNPSESEEACFTIVSCSRLIGIKRVNLIIDALSIIQDKKIKWIHLGGGPLQEELKVIAKNKLAHINYSFYGDVKNEDVLKFYKNNHVDLFINTSSSEGLPVSIMEVASFGIPIVATNVGGTKEIVSDCNGKLIPESIQAKDLANTIEDLINDNRIQQKRKGSRKVWEKKFNAAHNYKEFIKKAIE